MDNGSNEGKQRKLAYFKAKWSTRLTATTVIGHVIFISGPILWMILLGDNKVAFNMYIFLFLFVVPLGIIFFGIMSSLIKAYTVAPDGVYVLFPTRHVRFGFKGLQSIEADPEAMVGTYRMINGGFFCFGGKNCRNKRLGRFSAYATDYKHAVVMRYKDHTAVITPEDPELFIKRTNEKWRVYKDKRNQKGKKKK